MVALVGFLMIVLIVTLLLKGKLSPIVTLTIIPAVAALILGYTPLQVAFFIKEGMQSTISNAILFIFSVIFFGIMSDAGMFDVIVDFLVKKAGNNVIPIQIAGCVINIAFAVFLGLRAIRQGAGAGKGVEVEVDQKTKEKEEALKRPKLLIFNILFTVAVIGILATGWVTSYVVFMLGVCIALAVNYPNQKIQDSLVKKHAPAALMISVTLLSAGAMVGIFNQTGMLEAMSDVIMGIIPSYMGRYIHIIFGVLALPLGLCIGTDAYFYGIMPLVMKVGATYGCAPLSTALTMVIGKNLALMVSPLVPATYLAIGLTGTELKDHMKYSIPPYYLLSLVMVVCGIVFGIIPL